MSVDAKVVGEIAHLARLEIVDGSVEQLAAEMAGILALAEQMNSVDTDAVEPMAHPLHAVQRLREDVVTECDRREAYQAIAPAVQDGHYLVPQVIE